MTPEKQKTLEEYLESGLPEEILSEEILRELEGRLNQRATEVYKSLTEVEQDAAQHIFLSLTNLGEATEDTRRRVLKKNLITAKHDKQLIDNVVQKLANEKLIVTRDWVEQNSVIDTQVEVDVAHEALIRNWSILRQWLDESRDQLREQRKIEDAAQKCQASEQNTDDCLSKRRLREARIFQKEQQKKYPLSELAASFIARNSNYQRNKRQKSLGLFLLIPLIGATIGGYFLVREIQLNVDKKLIQDCEDKDYCHGRIEALERLVMAKRSLRSYNLETANLDSANLDSANLDSANLYGANLDSANLKSSYLNSANLDSANLKSSYLNSANLNSANLNSANLNSANLENTDLENANLKSANLENTDLNSANLKSANLENTELNSANLKSAYFSSADLSSAYLDSANLENANLENANLKSAYLSSADLDSAYLEITNLSSAYLDSANLHSAYLDSANLHSANLHSANLDSANLHSANLHSANLENANLDSANLKGANLENANLIEVKNLTPSQIKSACHWETAFYKGYFDIEKTKWIVDAKNNQDFIEELKQDQASDPKETVDCSIWQ